MPDCNNCIRVVLEGGVVEARGLSAAGHSAGEDADRRVVGGACLSDAEVTWPSDVVLVVVEGEDVKVAVEVTVAACEMGKSKALTFARVPR